jgi:sugar/nucleoside kinase (ribokinase family)
MTQPRYDLMTIGHFAKDVIVVDGKSESASGGGVYFGAMAARQLGLDVAVVTRLHPDDFVLLDELRQAGIDVYATAAAHTSGIENRYKSADMERRECIPMGFAGPFTPSDLPDATAKVFVIASIIAGEVDLDMLARIAGRGPVALDIQGFVRVQDCGVLAYRPWIQMREGLRYVTYLKADRAEAELLTGTTDLASAARQLAEYGPREIVLTESSRVTVLAAGEIFHAPFTPRSLAGRTGRGDTCFHTYLGKRLTSGPLEATRLAAAVTTLKQERPGPWRGTVAQAEEVIKSWQPRE